MNHYVLLIRAAACFSCSHMALDSAPSSYVAPHMAVVNADTTAIAKDEPDPEELRLIDFFSRRTDGNGYAGTPARGGSRGDQAGGQASPHPPREGAFSSAQRDQRAPQKGTPLDSARRMQNDALDEARALEAEGFDEKALLLMNSVITANEDFMEAYIERAKIHLHRNTYDLAARDYREAISCDAGNVEAHYGLGLSCEKWGERLEASGDRAGAQEKFREAVLEYKKTLWYSRGHAPAYYGLGCAYSRLGMREDAVYYFKRAAENVEHDSDLARRARYNMRLMGEP